MDLELLAGEFFYDESLPKGKRHLLKYFTTKPQRRFLVYAVIFDELRLRHGPFCFYRGFVDHTGVQCTRRVMQRWSRRLRELETALKSAMGGFDLEAVEKIKTGEYRFSE